MRSPLYRKVRDTCNSLVSRYRKAHLFPYAGGQCADCGSTKYLCYDHRSYDDPFAVDVVCCSCNGLRGAGAFTILDLDTLTRVQGRA